MTPVLAQAYALRAQMDALVMLLEASEGIVQPVPEPPGCPQCAATQDKVENATMLAGPRRSRCTNCGYVWETHFGLSHDA